MERFDFSLQQSCVVDSGPQAIWVLASCEKRPRGVTELCRSMEEWSQPWPMASTDHPAAGAAAGWSVALIP